jgi:hypothetical protein
MRFDAERNAHIATSMMDLRPRGGEEGVLANVQLHNGLTPAYIFVLAIYVATEGKASFRNIFNCK